MGTESRSALLPILRSQVQGDILALLFLHPEAEYTITQIAEAVQRPFKTVHAEVGRLVGTGYLADRKKGNMRLVSARTDTPVAGPLTALLEVTHGPLPILRDLLAGEPGVARAFIFGSWADRYRGNPGPVPRDIDVIVIGSIDLARLDDIAEAAEGRLHRPVTVRRIEPANWAHLAETDPFVRTIASSPSVELLAAETDAPEAGR